MKWTAHVTHVGGRRGVDRVLMGKPQKREDRLENLGLDGKVIFKIDIK
jgi:hypothetical protein